MAGVDTLTLQVQLNGSGDRGAIGPRSFTETTTAEDEYIDQTFKVAMADVDRAVSLSEIATLRYLLLRSDVTITFKINGGAESRTLRAGIPHIEATEINSLEFTGGASDANVYLFAVGS